MLYTPCFSSIFKIIYHNDYFSTFLYGIPKTSHYIKKRICGGSDEEYSSYLYPLEFHHLLQTSLSRKYHCQKQPHRQNCSAIPARIIFLATLFSLMKKFSSRIPYYQRHRKPQCHLSQAEPSKKRFSE